MKKITIVYATNSGGTYLAAYHLAEYAGSLGYNVSLEKAIDVSAERLRINDHVFFGTNTWLVNKQQGQPHPWYFELEKKLSKNMLKGLNCSVFALGDRSYLQFCESADVLSAMLKHAGARIEGDLLRIHAYHEHELESNREIERWFETIQTK